MRAIAASARVDAALVHHYYGTKRALFEAALELGALDGSVTAERPTGVEKPGERLVREFLDRWDTAADGGSLAGLLRASGGNAADATIVHRLIERSIIAPTIASIDPQRGMPKLRAQLIGAQLVGLAWLRYVLQIEPLATASSRIVAKTFGPSLDATLEGRDYTRTAD
ncbi:MAG: TetR family transcriptional regulator [Vulcanimicrobiaceae bacterium]